MIRFKPDVEWMADRIAPLPTKWQQRLRRAWQATHATDRFTANKVLRLQTDRLGALRVPLDAGDAEICAFAQARFSAVNSKLAGCSSFGASRRTDIDHVFQFMAR